MVERACPKRNDLEQEMYHQKNPFHRNFFHSLFRVLLVYPVSAILPIPHNRILVVYQRRSVRDGAGGWGTALQIGRSRVRFPMESLIHLIFLAALWTWD